MRKQEIRLGKQVRNQEIRRESCCGVGGGITRALDAVWRAVGLSSWVMQARSVSGAGRAVKW